MDGAQFPSKCEAGRGFSLGLHRCQMDRRPRVAVGIPSCSGSKPAEQPLPGLSKSKTRKAEGRPAHRHPPPRVPGCHLTHAGPRCLGAPVSASGVQPTSGGAHQHGAEPGVEHQTMSPNLRHVPTGRGVTPPWALVVLSMCLPQEKSQGTPASCSQGRPNHPCVEDTPETRADQGAQALCLI